MGELKKMRSKRAQSESFKPCTIQFIKTKSHRSVYKIAVCQLSYYLYDKFSDSNHDAQKFSYFIAELIDRKIR